MKPASRCCRRVTAGLAITLLLAGGGALAARQFVAIGTGEVTGVPYHAGGAICSMVNAGRNEHQIRCTAKSSGGSISNIDALRRGERDFGFAQSDLAQHAYRGSGPFTGRGEFDGLRVVAAMHPETVTIVARDGSGIDALQDLRGQRINLGPVDSGERATLQALLDALGWTGDDFTAATDLIASQQIDALCEGELDAVTFVAGHPSNAVQAALQCGHFVPVSGPAINRMVRNAPYYSTTVIPGGVYPGVAQEIPTYGVTSLLLSSTNTPRETVFEVTRAMFEQAKEFRGWHRAFGDLGVQRMAGGTRVVDVPLHPGAEMYYQDSGIL